MSARSELVTWHASREDYPRYEQTLAALRKVPEWGESRQTQKWPSVGDYDNMYRRFLSAQGGTAYESGDDAAEDDALAVDDGSGGEDASMEVHTSGAEI